MLKKLGQFERTLKTHDAVELDINDLQIGVNTFKDVFICLDENRNVRYVINKTCDHNGGKLIKKDDCAVCPLHGWKLDLSTLEYNNSHKTKTQLDYRIDKNKLIVPIEEYKIANPFLTPKENTSFSFRWLNHATIYFEFNGFKFATDPWLFGPAFINGWWLQHASTKDAVELLKGCDLIYISHNHPDHLHPETLSVIRKDIPIITGKFQSASSKKMLERCGFNNIFELEFKDIFEFGNGMQLSILKSGDFRDDSGLYLAIDGKEILLTADSNFLNSFELPQNIFLLATSFTSGASGFPLCFLDYSEEEKAEIIQRNKVSMKAKVLHLVKNTMPEYYMPYAGMFTENASRDKYIQNNNHKNKVEDYLFLEGITGCKLIYPENTIKWLIKNDSLVKEKIASTFLGHADPNFYIERNKQEYGWNEFAIINYLEKSLFKSNILLQIIPTDDSFCPVTNTHIHADFYKRRFCVKSNEDIVESMKDYRVETIYVRQEAFMSVVENRLPWEDISIGFQLRVKRNPNQYNSDFWYYFTNEYISGENYRHSVYCGACTVIEQNPIWNKEMELNVRQNP
jgi:CMP-N-acetylneuraminate monooxygenase